MFLAAIAHRYVFTHHPYMDDNTQPLSLWDTLTAMLDVRDVHDNIREHFTVVGKSLCTNSLIRYSLSSMGSILDNIDLL